MRNRKRLLAGVAFLSLFVLAALVHREEPRLVSPSAVIGVMSTASQSRFRDLLRAIIDQFEEACRGKCRQRGSVSVFFVVGNPGSDGADIDLQKEQRLHQDLYVLPMYENMNDGKSYIWIASALRSFPEADFIFKADMDTFIHYSNFHRYLQTQIRENLTYTYVGRQPSSYHKIPQTEAVEYFTGMLYGFSRRLAKELARSRYAFNLLCRKPGLGEDKMMGGAVRELVQSKLSVQYKNLHHEMYNFPGELMSPKSLKEVTAATIAVHRIKTADRMQQCIRFFLPTWSEAVWAPLLDVARGQNGSLM